MKLTPKVAAFGTSIRCNAQAADQLRELLARLGIELIVVPMGGFSIHIDAHLGMVDVDKALVDAPGLPHWFLDRLAELGIEPIWCHPGEEWGINCLTVPAGRVIMPDDLPPDGRAARPARHRGGTDPRTPSSTRTAAASTAPRWSSAARPRPDHGACRRWFIPCRG